MATTEFSVANANLQKIQPDILGFGITDFGDQLQFAENDVLRRIREEWWERYRHTVRYKDITKITSVEMDSSKLTDSQWTRATVYRTLGYYICPALTKFNSEGDEDRFQQMGSYYRTQYEDELQDILRDGVEYDQDGDSSIANSEKEAVHTLRLVR